MGLGYTDRRLAESVHGAARTGISIHQPEGVAAGRDFHAAALLLQSEKGKKERRCRGIQLDSSDFADSRACRIVAVHQAAWYGETRGECATAGARHAGGRGETGA